MSKQCTSLVGQIQQCQICQPHLPLQPKPILQVCSTAKILIAGQAPGRITHHKGVPFDDPSGERLRDWLGVTRAQFYDDKTFAIVPMGFCFPGTGKNGDLPPRQECADTWREKLLAELNNIELTIVIGQYAQQWHLNKKKSETVTSLVKRWQSQLAQNVIALPHPSPRNNRWLKQNPWFEQTLLPELKLKVAALV